MKSVLKCCQINKVTVNGQWPFPKNEGRYVAHIQEPRNIVEPVYYCHLFKGYFSVTINRSEWKVGSQASTHFPCLRKSCLREVTTL